MASVKTATALLTAESIVIAAFAFVVQGGIGKFFMWPTLLGAFFGFMISSSFLMTLSYLHAAEYPNGYIACNLSPKMLFNGILITFLIIVYSGIMLVYIFIILP